MSEETDKAKKLAALIRGSSESSEFDLAGYGGEQCDNLAAAAFAKALPLKTMVRLSFVVGGGKKVRQKYNDGLPALWADALKKVGFSEDRGASLAAPEPGGGVRPGCVWSATLLGRCAWESACTAAQSRAWPIGNRPA